MQKSRKIYTLRNGFYCVSANYPASCRAVRQCSESVPAYNDKTVILTTSRIGGIHFVHCSCLAAAQPNHQSAKENHTDIFVFGNGIPAWSYPIAFGNQPVRPRVRGGLLSCAAA
jgi:hypothetical protein